MTPALWTQTRGEVLCSEICRITDSIVTADYGIDGLILDNAGDKRFPETPKTAIMTARQVDSEISSRLSSPLSFCLLVKAAIEGERLL